MEKKKWLWKDVESEFTSMTENDRNALYRSFVNMNVLCGRCKETQNKKFHIHGTLFSRKIKHEPYEIGLQPYIDKSATDILSVKIPENIRGMVEEYLDYCFRDECEKGRELSKEAYDRFTNILNNKK